MRDSIFALWISLEVKKAQHGWVYMPRSPEVEFVHPVSPGGSVKFVASGVNFSIFTNFLCFFLLKLLKLGEIGGVKFLTWKSGGVKFWTNFMSASTLERNDHFHFHVWLCIIKTYPLIICQYKKTYQMMRKHKFVKMVINMVVQSTQKKGKRDKIAILTLSSLRWIGEKSLIRMGSDRDLYMSIDNCKRFLFVSFLSNLVIKHFQILMKCDRFLQR